MDCSSYRMFRSSALADQEDTEPHRSCGGRVAIWSWHGHRDSRHHTLTPDWKKEDGRGKGACQLSLLKVPLRRPLRNVFHFMDHTSDVEHPTCKGDIFRPQQPPSITTGA